MIKKFNQKKFNTIKKKVFPTKTIPRQGDVMSGYRKAMNRGKLGGRGWGP